MLRAIGDAINAVVWVVSWPFFLVLFLWELVFGSWDRD